MTLPKQHGDRDTELLEMAVSQNTRMRRALGRISGSPGMSALEMRAMLVGVAHLLGEQGVTLLEMQRIRDSESARKRRKRDLDGASDHGDSGSGGAAG